MTWESISSWQEAVETIEVDQAGDVAVDGSNTLSGTVSGSDSRSSSGSGVWDSGEATDGAGTAGPVDSTGGIELPEAP